MRKRARSKGANGSCALTSCGLPQKKRARLKSQGRAFLNTNAQTLANTLVLCTADHDQSMHIIGAVDTQVPNAIQNVISTLVYPNSSRGQGNVGIENRVGETEGFPDYQDANGDRYPENTNRIRIKVGYPH